MLPPKFFTEIYYIKFFREMQGKKKYFTRKTEKSAKYAQILSMRARSIKSPSLFFRADCLLPVQNHPPILHSNFKFTDIPQGGGLLAPKCKINYNDAQWDGTSWRVLSYTGFAINDNVMQKCKMRALISKMPPPYGKILPHLQWDKEKTGGCLLQKPPVTIK